MTNKRRILIIDDEQDITFVLKIVLEKNCFDVDTFNDPKYALINYHPKIYDLVILDIKLPHMSGYEVFERIRAVDKETKICFLTSSDEHHHLLDKASNVSGICLFIQKPIENQTFLKKINQFIDEVSL